MDMELEKTKMAGNFRTLEHQQKIEREKQRHENIMEELKLMAKNKITIFDRS